MKKEEMLPIIDALADFGNYYKSIIDGFFVWNLSNIEIEICKNKKGKEMTVQQLKYILKVAEVGSITEAAKMLLWS